MLKTQIFSGRGNVLFSWIKIILFSTVIWIVVIILSYNVAKQLIEEQITAINSGITAQIRGVLDNQFSEIEAVGLEIADAAFTPVVLISHKSEIAGVSHAYRDMVDHFRVTRATHGFIEEISLIHSDAEILITEDGILEYPLSGPNVLEFFIQVLSTLVTRPEWDRAAWIISPENKLYYIRAMMMEQHLKPAYLLIKIDDIQQRNILAAIQPEYYCILYVIDQNKNVLFSSGSVPEQFPGQQADMFLKNNVSEIIQDVGAFSAMKSEYADLLCCSFIPENIFLSDLNKLRNIFLGVSSAVAVICLILTVFFVFIHYRPLKKIISSFETELDLIPEKWNEYKQIESYAGQLLRQNKLNGERLRFLEEKMRNNNLERFLKGLLHYDQLHEAVRRNLPVTASWVLIQIKIAGSDFSSEVISLFLAALSDRPPDEIEFREIVYLEDTALVFAMVHGDDKEFEDKIYRFFKDSSRDFSKISDYKPVIVISRVFNKIEQAGFYYSECRKRLKEAEFFGQNDVLYAEAENPSDFIYLDSQEQKLLSEAVFSGDDVKTRIVLDSIIQKIEKKESGNADAARCMLFSTFTVLLQIQAETPGGSGHGLNDSFHAYSDFIKSEDINSMKQALTDIALIICGDINNARNEHKTRMLDKIINYVDTNLSDENMYLPSIADHFGMTPKYLSGFFKENSGNGLAEYIRRKRIEEACRLLEGKLTVKEIAGLTGFSNIISFNRTFKRIKKITPTVFRREIKMKAR